MSTRTASKRRTQKPPALKDFVTVPRASKRKLQEPNASDNSISVARLAIQRKIPSPTTLEDPLATDECSSYQLKAWRPTILRHSTRAPLVSKGNVLKMHSTYRATSPEHSVEEASVTKVRATRRQKARQHSVEENDVTEAVVSQNARDTTMLEDFDSGINEEGEEEGVLVLVVEEEPSDEQSTSSPPPDDVTTELDWNIYTHNSDINNDIASRASLDLDDIREESIEETADKSLTLSEYNGNLYDENSHLVEHVRRTSVQEEHVESVKDANEDNAEDQVCSPELTEHTEQVTEKKYQTHNPDVENLVLEKWVCGPQPDEKQLLELMSQPPPPLPDPLPYVKCEDSDEFRCKYCAYRHRSKCATGRHYREKHGPRYIYCFACGETFSQKVNLTKHEAQRCKAPGIATVQRVRAALIQSDRWRQERNKSSIKSQRRRKIEEPSELNKTMCYECGQQFADVTSLLLHQRIRSECRRFRCEFCPNAYTSPYSLKSHREIHLMQTFSCEYCGKTFKKKYYLVIHIRTHDKSKRFKCAYCDRTYCQNRTLLEHEAKHTGAVAPHVCSICDARYWSLSYLKVHMEKKHGMMIITKKKLFNMLPTMSREEMEASEFITSLMGTGTGGDLPSLLS